MILVENSAALKEGVSDGEQFGTGLINDLVEDIAFGLHQVLLRKLCVDRAADAFQNVFFSLFDLRFEV